MIICTEMVDYQPVDEIVQLTANTRECIGTIIEEDVMSEGNEQFDVVLLDDTGEECTRATVTLLDEEGTDMECLYHCCTNVVLL